MKTHLKENNGRENFSLDVLTKFLDQLKKDFDTPTMPPIEKYIFTMLASFIFTVVQYCSDGDNKLICN